MLETEKIAKLANIKLSEKELKVLGPQMVKIVSFVEKLSELNTDEVVPTYQVNGKVNELRDDVAGESLKMEEAIKNAKNRVESFFGTEKVL